jgi:hypothetical protein
MFTKFCHTLLSNWRRERQYLSIYGNTFFYLGCVHNFRVQLLHNRPGNLSFTSWLGNYYLWVYWWV